MEKVKVAKNAGWIIGIQLVKAILGMVISMLTARFIGPSNFGVINYASSIVAFAAPIMQLGFTGVLVQELVKTPEKEGEILGTAITLSTLSSLFCILGVFSFAFIANGGETETIIVCTLYSTLLIFQALEMMIYWFQARLLSKYSSCISLTAYAVISVYKIFLLATHKSIYWFALSNALDYMLIAAGLFIAYRKLGGAKLHFRSDIARKLLSKSKYYIISNMMITVFAQTDKIMLKIMIGDTETGYYSVAVTCAGMLGFVFSAIIDSFRPLVFDVQKSSVAKYEKTIITLYSIITYLSLAQSVAMTVLAPLMIRILYGSEYISSIAVLQVLTWYCTFSYLGGARDIWILAEQKQKHLLTINAVGAVMNIALNAVLIPRFQAVGAAIASVLTQFFINYIFVLIYTPTRRNGILQIKALNIKHLFSVTQYLKKRT